MAGKKFYWLKLREDFFRQKDIKKLRQIAGGDTFTIIYLKLLLRSLENGGKLYYDGLEEDFASEMALDIDERADDVQVTVNFLTARGILQQNTAEEYELITAAEMTGSECASAERMRKLRSRQQLSQCDAILSLSDGTVTSRDIDIDIDKETEKKERKKTESKTETDGPPTVPEKTKEDIARERLSGRSDALITTVIEWLHYKDERREAYRETGLKALLTQISNSVDQYGEPAMIDAINRSMSANYRGIVFDYLKKPKQKTDSLSGSYAMMEDWANG